MSYCDSLFYCLSVCAMLGIGLTACTSNSSVVETPLPSQPTQTYAPYKHLTTPFALSLTDTPTAPAPTPVPVPTEVPSLWIAPYLPAAILQTRGFPENLVRSYNPELASLRLEVGGQNPISHWVYALVVPFPTLQDQVRFEDILNFWKGDKVGPFARIPLLLDEGTYGVFKAWWGAPREGVVHVMLKKSILDYAWKTRPAWALIPFEDLEPRWKVLAVDGQSPVSNEFDLMAYPLTVPFSLNGRLSPQRYSQALTSVLPSTNRDPNKLTTLVMTGVTALVRGTSNLMAIKGVTYPDVYIRDYLRGADITHISNEVPFAEGCPLINPAQKDLRFCTNPVYIGLLEDVGTDVVELSGDHFIDWGPEATLFTLKLYKERGWLYYGGGANLDEGKQPAIIEHHGNHLAFIGCNAKGGGYATASPTYPGAVRCDYDWMHQKIKELRAEGYLPIATFQHQEIYSYIVDPKIRPDFTGMAEAGAVIVQGSQAHQPQNIEFNAGAFIHYGLGNLFFDQVDFSPVTQDAFIDRHIFYDGRYISTELLTIRFIDLAQSRPMTPEERQAFLGIIFKASGW